MTTKPTKDNVSAAKPMVSGAAFWAPLDVPVPKDFATKLSTSYECFGYLSADGVENTVEEDSESVTAFGGDTVLLVETSREESFVCTMIESLNLAVLKAAHGPENVTGTLETGIKILHNGKPRPEGHLVFEFVMNNGVGKRIVVPHARVTAVDSVKYVDSEPIGYPMTFGAFPNEDGNTAIEYIGKIKPPSSSGGGASSGTP